MKRHRSLTIEILTLFFTLFLIHGTAWAGKVAKVKGKMAFVKLSTSEQSSLSPGDKMYLRAGGKKKAIVKVKKLVKGRKYAIVQILKGSAKKGYLAKKKTAKSSSQPRSSVVREDRSKNDSAFRVGLLGGYALTNQSVTQNVSVSEQTGTMFAGKLLLDYSLFNDIGIRAQLGAEQFSVMGEGTDIRTGQLTEIGTTILYLSLDILLRGRFQVAGPFLFYLNAGVGILSPLSKETTALDEQSISTTSILIGGGGIGFNFGKLDVFFGADYYYFPPSEDVNTSAISIKGGFLYAF